jgi:hypothetical protein
VSAHLASYLCMQVGVLCNMAELVVRQLEKSWALEQLLKAKDANLRLVCCCLLAPPALLWLCCSVLLLQCACSCMYCMHGEALDLHLDTLRAIYAADRSCPCCVLRRGLPLHTSGASSLWRLGTRRANGA